MFGYENFKQEKKKKLLSFTIRTILQFGQYI